MPDNSISLRPEILHHPNIIKNPYRICLRIQEQYLHPRSHLIGNTDWITDRHNSNQAILCEVQQHPGDDQLLHLHPHNELLCLLELCSRS